MSNHDHPECCPPDDQRCDAFVKGAEKPYYRWMGHDRRCPRKAVQTREGAAVCHVHDRVKTLKLWSER